MLHISANAESDVQDSTYWKGTFTLSNAQLPIRAPIAISSAVAKLSPAETIFFSIGVDTITSSSYLTPVNPFQQ
jgi:hypothetical protein